VVKLISFVRGHEVYWSEIQDRWYYSDNNDVVPLYNEDTRPCIECNELPTAEGHDPCLGVIPDVVSACCGHGVDDGYKKTIEGEILPL
jgi:hypothetical protein